MNPMKRWVWTSFALIAGWIPAAPRQGTAQEAPKSSVIDSAQLLNDLKVLSSDAMEGRQAGTAGGDRARAFVVERFKA